MIVGDTKHVQIPSWIMQVLKDDYHDVFAITGGLGSGKTTGCAAILIYQMLASPRVPFWWALAPSYTRTEDTLLPAYQMAFEIFYDMKIDRDYFVKNSKPIQLILTKTGQRLYFQSGDRPKYLVGTTIGGYHVSEAGTMDRAIWERCTDRARDKKAQKIIGLVEGTPEGDNWYKEEFDFQGSDRGRRFRRFTLHTSDNQSNLAPGYVERLKRIYAYDEAKVEAYLYGRFSSFTRGNVFKQFFGSRNILEYKVEPDPALPIHLCYDFNFIPLCWSAWQVMPVTIRGRRVMQETCVAESSLNIDNLFASAVEFGQKLDYRIFKHTPIYLWGDRSGHAMSHKTLGSDYSNLQNYLLHVYKHVHIKAQRQVVPIRSSVDVCNNLFLYEMAAVSPHCVNMVRSFEKTAWKDTGKADIEKKRGETHTHHSDGVRYRLYQEYKHYDFGNLNAGKPTGINWA